MANGKDQMPNQSRDVDPSRDRDRLSEYLMAEVRAAD
jgi:hypothetical protein